MVIALLIVPNLPFEWFKAVHDGKFFAHLGESNASLVFDCFCMPCFAWCGLRFLANGAISLGAFFADFGWWLFAPFRHQYDQYLWRFYWCGCRQSLSTDSTGTGERYLKTQGCAECGISFFVLAVLCGLVLLYFRGWAIILFGIVGLIGGYGYTAGIAYKYKGLGTICVFFLMGPLMVGGAYFVQTATLNLPVFLISLPVACLVASILHSNDMRDLTFDAGANISTLALALGKEKSVRLSQILNLAPFLLLVCFVLVGWLPWLCLLTLIMLLSLPRMFTNARQTVQGLDVARLQMEGLAAKQHFSFCVIYFLTLWMGALFL